MSQAKPPDPLDQTHLGNPHAPDDTHAPVRVSQAVRVQSNVPVAQPSAAATRAPGQPPPLARPPAPAAGFNRTMIGIPPELQAVLHSAPPPAPAPTSSQPPAARSSSNSVVAAQRARVIGGVQEPEAQPTRQARTDVPLAQPRLGATMVMGAHAAAVAPQPANPEPPRASHTSGVHPSTPNAAMRAHGKTMIGAQVAVPQPGAGPQLDATKLANVEATGAKADGTERLSLSVSQQAERAAPSKPVRRWPALLLLTLALLAFGAVVVLRAPHLLPPPVAKLVYRLYTRGAAVPPPSTATTAPVPSDGVPGPAVLAPTPEITAPAPAPEPRRLPIQVQGGLAELEKQAIDRLLANDYPAAKLAYERLHTAAPSRGEYAVMVELLTRALTEPACGQPGQEPCR